MANQITITGALGRAPALNFTQSGMAAWGFSLAFTPSKKTDTGWEDSGPTLWFDVTVWGEDAEDLANRYSGVEKGRATVTGRLGSRTWTNREGVEQLQMTITADAVTIHPPKGQQQGSYSGQQQQSSGGYGQRAQAARVQQATSGSDHLAQPTQGGPRQQADQPWQQPAQQSMPVGGTYDEPPF